MKRLATPLGLFSLVAVLTASCGPTDFTAPAADEALRVSDVSASVVQPSCWGQASAVFAQMRRMGEHSSEQDEPRVGLRNLARLLADDGILPDDSMATLGAFVATELGLSIDACM